MGCTSSTPTVDAAGTDAAGRKHSRAPSFHAIGHAESRRDSSTADGESPAERRRRLRAERRTTTPARRMNGKPPLASSANNNTTNTNNNASSTANATKSHGASGSNSQSNFLTSFSASRNPLTHPTDDDGDDDLASAASSSAAHALPRTEMRQEHTPTTSQQLQQQQEQRQQSNTSPSQSLSASRRHVRHNAQGSDDNYVPISPAAAAVQGDGGASRHAAPHHEPVVQSLPATPASLRYSSPHPSPAPNRSLGDLPGQPHRPPPVTRQASSGRSFLTASGFFSTSDGAALSGS